MTLPPSNWPPLFLWPASHPSHPLPPPPPPAAQVAGFFHWHLRAPAGWPPALSALPPLHCPSLPPPLPPPLPSSSSLEFERAVAQAIARIAPSRPTASPSSPRKPREFAQALPQRSAATTRAPSSKYTGVRSARLARANDEARCHAAGAATDARILKRCASARPCARAPCRLTRRACAGDHDQQASALPRCVRARHPPRTHARTRQATLTARRRPRARTTSPASSTAPRPTDAAAAVRAAVTAPRSLVRGGCVCNLSRTLMFKKRACSHRRRRRRRRRRHRSLRTIAFQLALHTTPYAGSWHARAHATRPRGQVHVPKLRGDIAGDAMVTST